MESPVILEDAASIRQYSRDARHRGRTIGLVPTMGSLHEGHLSLIDGARQHADCIIVSIYINPTQFAQHEDFGVYPRERERDIQLVKQYKVDAVFMPKSLYAKGQSDGSNADVGVVVGAKSTAGKEAYQTFVQVEELQKPLCGQSRPHFFRGVATVVAKLFNIVEPDVALFGRKDFQQFLVLSTMARELDFPVRVIGMPIVREEDGLAMSSRNKLLSQDDRQRALCISKALKWASQSIASGTCTARKELHDNIAQQISEAGGRVDYVEVVNAHTLEPVADARSQPTLIAVAAFFGTGLLADEKVEARRAAQFSRSPIHHRYCQQQNHFARGQVRVSQIIYLDPKVPALIAENGLELRNGQGRHSKHLRKSLSLASRGSAHSESVYHDADSDLDDSEGLGTSARDSPSPDGSSPGHPSTTHGSQEGDAPHHFLISPFALLARAKDSLRRSGSISRPESDPVHLDKGYSHNGLHDDSSTAAEMHDTFDSSAVMEQEGKRDSLGCISMFQGPPKRFIRTIKPVAGSSFNKQAAGIGRTDGIECWEEAEPTTFMVRGQCYMQDKKKVPSEHSIYRLLGCDVYSFDFKINHIARHIQLPNPPHLGPAAKSLSDAEQIPPLLVLNIQLPMYPASFFGKSDGHGHSLVYYFGLPEGWEPSMIDNAAALALWQRFVHDGTEHDGHPTRSRLKLIPRVANVEQWAKDAPLSTAEFKLLSNYNDKPVLTRPQHRFFFGPNYMEIDLDIHAWAFFARKAFSSYIPRLGTVVFENAFVIQGNSEDELPEVVLACTRVSRVDFKKVRPFPAELDMAVEETARMHPMRFNERGSLTSPMQSTDKPLVATAI